MTRLTNAPSGAARLCAPLTLLTLLLAGCGGGDGGNSTQTAPPTPPPAAVTLASLSPASATEGSDDVVTTVTGTGFTTSSTVDWNGVALKTSYVSDTSLTAVIPASDLDTVGTASVTVSNASAGGASSSTVTFTIASETPPTIASLAPSTAVAGSAGLVLTLSGINFAPTATVLWNGRALNTGFQSATALTAVITPDLLATPGSAVVSVANDASSGGTSNTSSFTISVPPPAPTLTSIAPTSLPTSGGGPLTLTGTNFTTSTVVSFNNGSQLVQPTFVSSTQLTVSLPAGFFYAGSSISVAVRASQSSGIDSSPVTLMITPGIPLVTGLSPSSVTVLQSGVAVTVSGRYFSATSVVYVNGNARPTSTDLSGNLIVQLTAGDLANTGSDTITVEDPASGNIASNPQTLTVMPLPPLALTSLSPATVPAGSGDFTLTVFGNGFTTGSAIAWNGTTLTTHYVSGTTLKASIAASLVVNPGTLPSTIPVTVVNPAGEGGTSAPLSLTLVAPSLDAVSYQINSAHTGSITFPSASLPSAAAWSVNVGGTPSTALIAGTRVYVMANLGGNSNLLALDSATGATVWGPLQFSGAATFAYDSGRVLVSSGAAFLSTAVVNAVDAGTGAALWSAPIPNAFASQAQIVASAGIVYTLEDGVVTAFSETNGAQLWLQTVTGTDGSVAVTLDGVYASPPCTATALQPLTGAPLWTVNTGCVGGGGATPIVAGGRMYASMSPGSGFSGDVYDAETGTVLGTVNYTTTPAATASNVYALVSNNTSLSLESLAASNNQVNWTFTGDGTLASPPIVVNNYVFEGSSNGNLYALDATSGSLLRTWALGAAVPGPYGNQTQGLTAGDGLLVVPAGNTVTAFVISP